MSHCFLTYIWNESAGIWLPRRPSFFFFFFWWLVNCSRRLWLIIAHASDCTAPDNDGSMDLSFLPHGLLLNDSGEMSTADCDMIHVVFSWVKFVWDPHRHFSPRCYCSLLCLPLSQDGRKKKTSSYFLFFLLTGSQCPIFKNSVHPAPENNSIPFSHIVLVRIVLLAMWHTPGRPCQSHHLFIGRLVSTTSSQQGCVNMASCMWVFHNRMN